MNTKNFVKLAASLTVGCVLMTVSANATTIGTLFQLNGGGTQDYVITDGGTFDTFTASSQVGFLFSNSLVPTPFGGVWQVGEPLGRARKPGVAVRRREVGSRQGVGGMPPGDVPVGARRQLAARRRRIRFRCSHARRGTGPPRPFRRHDTPGHPGGGTS